MTTIFPLPPQEQQDIVLTSCARFAASFPDLSTLSTLWVPLHEVRQAWAAFGKEALTTSALMATSTAFGGLFWEAHALQHSQWASQERERERWHQVVFWLSRAVQDLDCALDQWQQALSWLDLAGNDPEQVVAKGASTLNIRGKIARIDVGHAGDKGRPQEREQGKHTFLASIKRRASGSPRPGFFGEVLKSLAHALRHV
jgi:hypothetical protein